MNLNESDDIQGRLWNFRMGACDVIAAELCHVTMGAYVDCVHCVRFDASVLKVLK